MHLFFSLSPAPTERLPKTAITRRSFLGKSLAAMGFAGIPILVRPSLAGETSDQLPLSTVEEFVKAGHNDLSRTREMLENEPGLLNAAWDWGGGDFETALGGASHVGNKEIARYLLEKGARMNLFTATMLGEVGIVKPWLDAYPVLAHSKGPHGLSLLHHAERGGHKAMVELIKRTP